MGTAKMSPAPCLLIWRMSMSIHVTSMHYEQTIKCMNKWITTLINNFIRYNLISLFIVHISYMLIWATPFIFSDLTGPTFKKLYRQIK